MGKMFFITEILNCHLRSKYVLTLTLFPQRHTLCVLPRRWKI